MTTTPDGKIDRATLPPPSWWHGDEYAAEVSAALYKTVDEHNLAQG